MNIFFKINSLGEGLGPKFILTDDFGLTNPFEFTGDQLLNGVEITVTPGSKYIYVTSTGLLCNDCCEPSYKQKYILPTTTTTSTTTTIPPFICFAFEQESAGSGLAQFYLQLPSSGNLPPQNGRPAYDLSSLFGVGTTASVYFDGVKWVYFNSDFLGVFQTLNTASSYPISDGVNPPSWTPSAIGSGFTGGLNTSVFGVCPTTTTTSTSSTTTSTTTEAPICICFDSFLTNLNVYFNNTPAVGCIPEIKTICQTSVVNGKPAWSFTYDCDLPICYSGTGTLGTITWSILNNRWELKNSDDVLIAHLALNPSYPDIPIGPTIGNWTTIGGESEFIVSRVITRLTCPEPICITYQSEAVNVLIFEMYSFYDTLDSTPGPSFTKNSYVGVCSEAEPNPFKIIWNATTNKYEFFQNNIKIAETNVTDLATNYNLNWTIEPDYQFTLTISSIKGNCLV